MSEITRVGVDLVKSVIQVHAVDAAGKLWASPSSPDTFNDMTTEPRQVPDMVCAAAGRLRGG